MSDIVWISFKLSDLFSWSKRKDLSLKNYKSYTKFEEGMVEAVTGSKTSENNVYYKIHDLPNQYPVYENCLTLTTNGSIGYCFYYRNRIISPTSSVHILLHKNKKLQECIDETINNFLAKIITFSFISLPLDRSTCLIDQTLFDSQIILLPCIQIKNPNDSMWQENGDYYALATDYIYCLMDEARDRKDQKTIRVFEAEKKMYEEKKNKYENNYLEEKEQVIWKSFMLGDLFRYTTGRDSSIAQKNLDFSNEKTELYSIAVVTETKFNNGIGFYMKSDDEVLKGKIHSNGITIGTQFGFTAYHDYPYFIIGNTNYLDEKNECIKECIQFNPNVGNFFASVINYVFCKHSLYSYSTKIDKNSFSREFILLPCIEVSNSNLTCDGKCYRLAVDYINYIFSESRLNFLSKKIDSYDRGF